MSVIWPGERESNSTAARRSEITLPTLTVPSENWKFCGFVTDATDRLNAGAQNYFDHAILLVAELLVHLWRIFKAGGMCHDEARIDLPAFIRFSSGLVYA